jgi:HK97 family phage major capsid protein
MSIVLRKIGGRLTPLWQSRDGGSLAFSAAEASPLPLLSAFGWLALAVIVLAVLAWALTHTTFHPASLTALGGLGFAGETAVLSDKRKELAAKAAKWSEADKLSASEGGRRDMSQKPLLELLGVQDAASAKSAVDALYLEITDLNAEIDDLSYREQKSSVNSINDELKRPIRTTLPASGLRDGPTSFGQMVVDSKEFKSRGSKEQMRVEVDVDLKTLLQTSAGWQPRTGNGDRVVEKIIRPVQLLDRIPTDTTDLFEVPFMTETTRTQAAAEVAEAGTYAEDAFVFTRSASAVRKIGSQIPVTDEQLQDVGSMRSLLDNRLRFGLEARLDQQILVGDGISPNIQGVFTVSGIQTQAKGADATANAIFKALTLVRITGRAIPDTIVMHGTDWANVRLAQNAQGDYQFGPPTLVGADTMWGLPVVQSEALTAGNAVVGAFNTYSQLLYKKGIEVTAGWVGTQFIEGKMTLRADLRAAFVIYRGAAFAKITGL